MLEIFHTVRSKYFYSRTHLCFKFLTLWYSSVTFCLFIWNYIPTFTLNKTFFALTCPSITKELDLLKAIVWRSLNLINTQNFQYSGQIKPDISDVNDFIYWFIICYIWQGKIDRFTFFPFKFNLKRCYNWLSSGIKRKSLCMYEVSECDVNVWLMRGPRWH